MKNNLTFQYSKRERDFIANTRNPRPSDADLRYICTYIFPKEILEELSKRGYDLTTIKFNIEKK